jgi:RNA polymerase sigma-70 factor (ECF subfamily)
LRKRKNREQPLGSLEDRPAARQTPEAALEVERLLATLRPEDRFILLMLDGEGWSVAEIADRLGWSKVNVKVRAHRARRKLRNLLEEGPK